MKRCSTSAFAALLLLSGTSIALAQQSGTSTMSQGGQTGSTAQSTTSPGQTSPGPTTATQVNDLGKDTVRTKLQAQGYSDIEDLEKDGNEFKGKAKRYGETVDFRLDARTGEIRKPERLSEDQVKNKLKDEGYSNVSDVERDGDIYEAKAEKDDKDVRLKIDGRTDAVTSNDRKS
jgi:hypothetical protein